MAIKTTQEWIAQAKSVHGDKYDYSKTVYVNWKTKVCIICPEHGEFWQAPESHIRGCSCPRCSISSAGLSIDERKRNFIEKSNKIYNRKYDYSHVVYQGKRTKVCIICPEHGEFWQTPERHLQNGCPKCSQAIVNETRYNKNVSLFIKNANEIHNGKYDYSKTVYVNWKTKVCIICPEHGEFWQTPERHLQNGCPKCHSIKCNEEKHTENIEKLKAKYPQYNFTQAIYNNCTTHMDVICPIHGKFEITPHGLSKGYGCPKCSKTHKSSTKEFIDKAKKIHGDKYDYSKVDYFNARIKVCIICPEHGEFWIRPNSHLNKQGCAKCSAKSGKRLKQRAQNFIDKAKKIHGDKYDYSKVDYVNSTTKVCIICPEHGEFWQVPSYHISGNACPKCNMSWLEREVMNFLDDGKYQYEYQKKFPEWLGRQSLDFFLSDFNVAIECQGEQHFKPIKYFGGEEKFESIIKRDKKKRKLCECNNIKILYYTTEEFKEYGFCDINKLFDEIKKDK